MATCKDCLYVDVCMLYLDSVYKKNGLDASNFEDLRKIECDDCGNFKDSSRFVELPDVGDYDTVTTLDEAIDHCYQIATSADDSICTECKAEHMRLCGWLGDLKSRIVDEQTLKEHENSE